MALLGRWVGRKPVFAAPSFDELGLISFIFRQLATVSSRSYAVTNEHGSLLTNPRRSKGRKVAVFWDLDNKPPKSVPPFKAATCLKEMASKFGEVVGLVAYANHHAFSHVPSWVHEERRHRKVLDILEKSGEVKPDQPYVCGVCGAKKKTHVDLTKHFKMLHEREQKKRMIRLDSLKGKKRQKARFLERISEKVSKYKDSAQSIIVPRVGYGLMQEIKRAGVYVRTVKDEPEAADIALKENMIKSIKRGIQCICLVSDDADFKPELKLARERKLHTVVVGDLRILSAYADTYFSWAEVATGRAEEKARLISGQLMAGSVNALSCRSDDSGPNRVLGLDGEGVFEDDSGSDSGSESDEEAWAPRDTYIDVREDESFDSFSDDTSDSDSESDRKCDDHMRSNLYGCITNSKFSTYAKVPSKWRGFSTNGGFIPRDQLTHEDPSKAEKATSAAGPHSGKGERLHHFFTMLEGINKAHPVGKNADVARGDTPHFTRVRDILRPLGSERGSGHTTKNDMQAIDENRDEGKEHSTDNDIPSLEENFQNGSKLPTQNHIEANEEDATSQINREEDEPVVGEKEVESQVSNWEDTLSSDASENVEEKSGKRRKGTRFGPRNKVF